MLKVRRAQVLGDWAEYKELACTHSVCARASDLSQIGSQLPEENIPPPESLHLSREELRVFLRTGMARPTLNMLKGDVHIVLKHLSSLCVDIRCG